MSKLINANDLSEKLNEMSGEPGYQHPGEDWSIGLCMAMSAVDEAPAVDAVEVVRCGECTHADWAAKCPYCLLHECYMDDENSFCSNGSKEV